MSDWFTKKCAHKDEGIQQALCALLQIWRALSWLQERGVSKVFHDQMVFYRENSADFYRLVWLPTVAGRPDRRSKSFTTTKNQKSSPAALIEDAVVEVVHILSPNLGVQLAEKFLDIFQASEDGGLDKMSQYAEYLLFGPMDDLTDQNFDPLPMIQRWLDVERASVLNELIRTQGLWRIKLSVLEEFHLSFLVSVSPQILIDSGRM